MELLEAMRSVGACRYYKDEPVPPEVLYQAFEAARFAPQGGNRQPVRWVVVEDAGKKRALRDLYLEPWNAYLAKARTGEHKTDGERVLSAADHFAQNMHEIPAIVVVCARIEDLHVSDRGLDREPIVAGASIYPTVQNFCLACRDLGVATALTTLLCTQEPKVMELLEIPEGYATAAHIAVGYPVKSFPKKLKRLPVEEVTFLNTFGSPFADVRQSA